VRRERFLHHGTKVRLLLAHAFMVHHIRLDQAHAGSKRRQRHMPPPSAIFHS
jgi:hypothetical protein